MLDLLVFGAGVVVVPGARLVLVRLRCGRWSEPPASNEYLPPPAGHRAVAAGGCTLECSCGWWHRVPWPPTSRRLNRARSSHFSAVEQQHLAQRLGVDAESMLDRVLTAQGAPRRAPEPAQLEPARSTRRAAEARRASAIARVEAGRVLPKHTGTDG